ncbi:MAG: enoyl-CoA hydratase/isomerase family protein [Promethearchaeota archaeon]|nr:MAG: enoyl-CoA hydratase/isomerase family protein [Candidatus Lokiarchaeota archaeon]
MSKLETIILEIEESENYAIIYLNRPIQLNALNFHLAEDFCSALEIISKSDKIRCILITGKGNTFCAGGDLAAFKKAEKPDNFLFELATIFHKGIKIMKNLNVPSIAAVNGACFDVGLSLGCACDLRICSEKAKFGVAFTSVGLSPDSSLTFHLPKIEGLPLANEIAILNRILNADEAKLYNLVSKITSEDVLLEEAKGIAQRVSHGSTLAYGSTKKLFTMSFSNDLNAQLNEEIINIKKNATSEDFKEGVNSFLEKRKPLFKGK